ncbi:hypothetical protein ATCC90586_002724 [Pythium insidiosum]|nr:hypothetical protein ATCC90586_002724 [Pythium insidiosum]
MASAARARWTRSGIWVRSLVRFRLLHKWARRDSARSWTETYECLGLLGVGGAAAVFLVRVRETQALHAMKVMRCAIDEPWSRATLRAQREQRVLSSLHHPFVCGMIDSVRMGAYLGLILDFHAGGSLEDVRHASGGVLCERDVLFYAAELVQTLEYIHTMGFVHRDLKPQNVLLAADGHIRLADFGVAREGLAVSSTKRGASALPDGYSSDGATTTATSTSSSPTWGTDAEDGFADDHALEPAVHPLSTSTGYLSDDRLRFRSTSLVGTPEYMPPEMILQHETQSTDLDWWALGCLLYELLYGVPPFRAAADASSASPTKALFRRILRGSESLRFPSSPKVSDRCKDLIRRLLATDATKRLGHDGGAAQVKQHAFFHQVRWALLQHDHTPPVAPRATRDDGCLLTRSLQIEQGDLPSLVADIMIDPACRELRVECCDSSDVPTSNEVV